ncbi:MAG: hypothetical protein PHQ96_03200 [Candidatus Omnitrophica bacterium]|nr:hypothetical protein [Candidatus Omnitrophota bacterium]
MRKYWGGRREFGQRRVAPPLSAAGERLTLRGGGAPSSDASLERISTVNI